VSALEILDTIYQQTQATRRVDHRPWPLPPSDWTSAQSWVDLAFLHWRVDEAELRRIVPGWVELDTFDGAAWLGITAFLLTGLRLRGLPPAPLLSTFPEVNVRTYVTHAERPGIWFFSLDAGSTLFVEVAKRTYRLPYHRARMRCDRTGDGIEFESRRAGAELVASYRGDGPLFHAEPGTLEHFLTERYCLYTEDGGRLYRADIHHAPWDLQHGEASLERQTLSALPPADEAPHVLFSSRQDTVVWPLEEL
jgi:uncharacterized protein